MDCSEKDDDPDFVWQDYLDDTGSKAVPPVAFSHVEFSLESGFKVGMKLETSVDEGAAYWIATVIMTCGDLLTLRYLGDDRTGDFWFSIKSGEFHPVGWCSANNKELKPPKRVLDKCPDVGALLSRELKVFETIPASLSDDPNAGFIPIEQIKCGMKLELSETNNPQNHWIVTIERNVGGRLLLNYDGCKGSPIWLFYLSHRLYPIGYAESHGLQYAPPTELKHKHSEKRWESILKSSLRDAAEMVFPIHILEPKIPLERHAFEVGMRLVAVNNHRDLCPATVTQIINDYHFLVTIDDESCVLCCHSNSPFIFPIHWAQENGLDLKTPKGFKGASVFSWDEYLRDEDDARAAPPELFSMCFVNMGFEAGMKLEAADPFCLSDIKVATIMKVVEPLMWLHFDEEECDDVITSVDSSDVFPVGWCDTNSYPLITPATYKPKTTPNRLVNEELKAEKPLPEAPVATPSGGQQGKLWCPKIFFNHRCFTGPLLSKGRLAELPRAIGPGPLHLVIQDVICRVVNIAYKSSRVLQLLQIEGKPAAGMQGLTIKAKHKGKTYQSTIEVIRNSEQVEEFCKNFCTKLECCPYLFGPQHVGEDCPNNCHSQTKTKFSYNFLKKKKVGRPPNPNANPNVLSTVSTTEEEVIRKGPGRKKKRKHWSQLNADTIRERLLAKELKSKNSSETDDSQKSDSKESKDMKDFDNDDEVMEVMDEEGQEEEFSPKQLSAYMRKKMMHAPTSSMVTRGAKLPNFGLWHHHHHHSPFHKRRGRPRTRPMRPMFPPRKPGRPIGTTKKAMAEARLLKNKGLRESFLRASPIPKSESSSDYKQDPPEEETKPKVEYKPPTLLESNPLEWSVEDVTQYLQRTDYAPLAPLLKEQEIDGQALLMLNLCNVQEHLHLKPEPAEKFCYLIRNLKIEFFSRYVTKR